jgi:hypothetical protein
MDELAEAACDYLAWTDVAGRVTELNLTAQQAQLASERKRQANDTVNARIAASYIWALVPEQADPARPAGWQIVKAEGSQDRLADRVTTKLRQGGLLATSYGARNVRMDLDGPLASVWQQGHVVVADLWAYYRRYPYLTRLRDRSVLESAVRSVLDEITWELEGFALAEGYDEANARYRGLAIPHENSFGHVTDTTVLVAPALARAQRQSEQPPEVELMPAPGADPTSGVVPVLGYTFVAPADSREDRPATTTRFFGVVKVSPERYGRDMSRVAQEILQHLAAASSAELEVTIEVRAVSAEGFTPETIRTVTENAKTLKFDQFGFESE